MTKKAAAAAGVALLIAVSGCGASDQGAPSSATRPPTTSSSTAASAHDRQVAELRAFWAKAQPLVEAYMSDLDAILAAADAQDATALAGALQQADVDLGLLSRVEAPALFADHWDRALALYDRAVRLYGQGVESFDVSKVEQGGALLAVANTEMGAIVSHIKEVTR